MYGDTNISAPAPLPVDYGQATRDGLQAQVDIAPDLYAAEANPQYGRKAYARLNQEVAMDTLLGEEVEFDSQGRQIEGYSRPAGYEGGEFTITKEQKLYKDENGLDQNGIIYTLEDANGARYNTDVVWTNVQSTDEESQGFRDVSFDEQKKRTAAAHAKKAEAAMQKAWGKKVSNETINDFAFNVTPTYYSGQVSISQDGKIYPEEPVYAKDANGEVIVNEAMAGKKERKGGGLVDVYAGTETFDFKDKDGNIENRRAGFDKDGNFQGLSKLANDLQTTTNDTRVKGELQLIEEYGDKFTDEYRKQGDIQGALDKASELSNRSAIPSEKLNAQSNRLSDLAASFGEGRQIDSVYKNTNQQKGQKQNPQAGDLTGKGKGSATNQSDLAQPMPVNQTGGDITGKGKGNAQPINQTGGDMTGKGKGNAQDQSDLAQPMPVNQTGGDITGEGKNRAKPMSEEFRSRQGGQPITNDTSGMGAGSEMRARLGQQLDYLENSPYANQQQDTNFQANLDMAAQGAQPMAEYQGSGAPVAPQQPAMLTDQQGVSRLDAGERARDVQMVNRTPLVSSDDLSMTNIPSVQDAVSQQMSADQIGSVDTINAQGINIGSRNQVRDVSAQNIMADTVQSDNISAQQAQAARVEANQVESSGLGTIGGLRDELVSQANQELLAGGDLTARELRSAQQQARAASTARGRTRDTSSVLAELRNNEELSRQRQADRRSFAAQVFGQESGLRATESGQELQASLANQQAGLQSSLANQQAGLQASLANQSASLDADRLNQQSNLQASLSNQQAGLQAGQANQQAALQVGTANQQADSNFLSQVLSASQANQQADLTAQQSNASNQLGMSSNRLALLQANQQAGLQESLANQQRDQLLAQNTIGVEQANQQLDMQSQIANQQSQIQQAKLNQDAQRANQSADLNYGQRQVAAESQNQQAQMGLTGMDQAAQVANQSNELARQQMLLGATEKDIDRDIQVGQINQAFEQSGLQMDRAAAAQRVGLEQATSADPMQAITGRPSGAGVVGAGNLYGNAAQNIQTPMMYNPAQGAEFIANQAAGLNSYNAAMASAQATASAGRDAMWGNMISGAFQGAGLAASCWVAREVFGLFDLRWIQFRTWMMLDSPSWFRKIYMRHGEKFAEWIKDKPWIKKIIKSWMLTKIKKES